MSVGRRSVESRSIQGERAGVEVLDQRGGFGLAVKDKVVEDEVYYCARGGAVDGFV